jgi:cobalamin 5'-phosphate synthase/cobalamin synthase
VAAVTAGRGLLTSLSVLTAVPVPARAAGGTGPRWAVLGLAPVVGLLLGGLAAGVAAGGRLLFPGALGSLVAAALAVGALALATRGLHLDGLADTADGLGVLGDRERSLAVMRRGDVGPFGVTALVVVLLLEVVSLARDVATGRGPLSVLFAVLAGRVVMTLAGADRRVAAARPDGLGAAVVRSVPGWWAVTAACLTVGATLSPLGAGDPVLAARLAGGVVAGLAAGLALVAVAVRRLGGVTGDVLGAAGEVATLVALLGSAVG